MSGQAAFRKLLCSIELAAEPIAAFCVHSGGAEEGGGVSETETCADTATGMKERVTVAAASRRLGIVAAFDSVVENYKRLFVKLSQVNVFLRTYEQAIVILPFVLVAQQLFDAQSGVTMGVLMRTTDAFGRVAGALTRLAEALPALNDWRSVRVRLAAVERTVEATMTTALVEVALSSTSTGGTHAE